MNHPAIPLPHPLPNEEIVYLSPWLEKTYPDFFQRLATLLNELQIAWRFLPCTNDIWCRDFMPFAIDRTHFLQYRYYPDYLLLHEKDKCYITDAAKVCAALKLPCIKTDLILDGGNMVKAGDCLIMTEKIFKENPTRKPADLLKELEDLTRLKVLLLPWDRAERYGHTDGIVRPIDDHTVLMTNYEDFDKKIAREIESRLENHFKVIKLKYDVPHKDKRNWAYINYLEVGHHIILPALGIPEDAQALAQIQHLFPNKRLTPLRMEEIIRQGGALNCLTWTSTCQ